MYTMVYKYFVEDLCKRPFLKIKSLIVTGLLFSMLCYTSVLHCSLSEDASAICPHIL